MRIFHRICRTIGCAFLLFISAMAAIAVDAAAQTQNTCPPIIASILPKNASGHTGEYFKGGEGGDIMITGRGSADIPFEHRCIKSTKFPAHVSIKVTYFGGELVEVFKWQGEAAAEQFMYDAAQELEQNRNTLLPGMSETKREKLAGGEIVYFEYLSECPPEKEEMAEIGEMIVPNVTLKGVTLTENAQLEVELYGSITVEAAKAAVTEVFENIKKADFSKVK